MMKMAQFKSDTKWSKKVAVGPFPLFGNEQFDKAMISHSFIGIL